MTPPRKTNDADDDIEVAILRGPAARKFLSMNRDDGDEDDDEPEAPEGHEYDEDGYLRRIAKAVKAPAAKKRGWFDPLSS